MPTTAATVIGSTGLVGTYILTHLLSSPQWASVTTISRRAPKPSFSGADTTKLTTVLEHEAGNFGAHIPASSTVVFSSLGSTRAAAGSFAAQWKIDHDANVSFFKAARANPEVRTAVLISSGGTRSFLLKNSPYGRMKNGAEDALFELDFPATIVLRPGMILGQREEHRTIEGIGQAFLRGVGALSSGLKDTLGQDAEIIGRAAVKAAEIAERGEAPSKIWVLEAADIMKYGRMADDKERKDSTATATQEPERK